ncbi:MAG: DNA methyltransferase yeeA [Hyphobacterium sp.]|nr:MAG: DNA methyltransferase yeeA [Hyphobacterium sp.]
MSEHENPFADVSRADIEAFTARWRESGGMEIANTQPFLNEFCDLLGLPRPEPSKEATALNDYVFVRSVTRNHEDGSKSSRRIDLYKRGAFVLEAKQGSDGGGSKKADEAQKDMFGAEAGQARAGTARRGTQGWVTAMRRARNQAEAYAKDLPPEHGWPPFLIVADIGHCFEIYADFSGQGKAYEQFPDRRHFRIELKDLLHRDVRDRLRAIWTEPQALDPAKKSAEATRDIAARLAKVARELEKKHPAEDVATFLMRCLFAMFAEDVGLMKKNSFTQLLSELKDIPDKAHIALQKLFQEMDQGTELSAWTRDEIRRFNGGLFKNARALPMTAEMVSELHIAARKEWTEVEPAIFGTLLEQALDKKERHRLGAHYTPRAYVDRLVTPTIIEPLRDDWAGVQAEVQVLLSDGKDKAALKRLREFHAELCEIKVLDPACGTGNFLYVAMERMKRLEAEIVDMIVELGGRARTEYKDHTIDPHQFLGIEINPRAAAIAELVLWIGYIQWQVRSGGIEFVYDPVLRDFHNIKNRDAILTDDGKTVRKDEDGKIVSRWDGETMKQHPVTGEDVPDEAARKEIYDFENPRPADWPAADFIVGNPPFIGISRLRSELGDGYAEALWAAHPQMPKSADFVMYWWHHAADRMAKGAGKKGDGKPRRFGFITTNSIRQTFNRRVVEKALSGKPPLSIVFAIPDHPWMKSADKAAVRIAMTVVELGAESRGALAEATTESALNTDQPQVELKTRSGVITPMLRIGAAVGSAKALKANDALCSPGVKLHGSGFIVTPKKARSLGLGTDPAITDVIKPYRNGRDINQKPRGVMVIDLFGLSAIQVQTQFSKIYQHVLENVKPERDQNRRKTYRDNWWIFGEPRALLRPAIEELSRIFVTTETAKHRIFDAVPKGTMPDNKLICFALSGWRFLALLHGYVHFVWFKANSAKIGMYEGDAVYPKTLCFDPFPFPDFDGRSELKARLDQLGERLDEFRKERLAEHDFLTMTKLYNVLERVRALEAGKAGEPPLTDTEKDIYDAGLIAVLKEIHDEIDAAVFESYGWPADLDEEDILQRLVDLNHERAAEEARGHIRWLRPEFQNPTGKDTRTDEQTIADLGEAVSPVAARQKWPKDKAEQAKAVRHVLSGAGNPISVAEAAAAFDGKATKKKLGEVEDILSILSAVGQAEIVDDHYISAG